MDFLKVVENQSELLTKKVKEKEGISFFTVASDDGNILCEGAGYPDVIARNLWSAIKRSKPLLRAFREEIESENNEKKGVKVVVLKAGTEEEVKNAIEKLVNSL